MIIIYRRVGNTAEAREYGDQGAYNTVATGTIPECIDKIISMNKSWRLASMTEQESDDHTSYVTSESIMVKEDARALNFIEEEYCLHDS